MTDAVTADHMNVPDHVREPLASNPDTIEIPRQVAELDATHLHQLIISYHRLRWLFLLVFMAITLGALGLVFVQNLHQNGEIARLQQIVQESCPLLAQISQDKALPFGIRDTAIQSYGSRQCQPPLTDPP